MTVRPLLCGLMLFLATLPLGGQDAPALFPLSQVKPGLKAVGRTVFEGDQIEEFQVEIVGVLKNAIAPKHDVILARLSGGPLADTGVIAGMSGSPVYVDGKLLGAVALSFPFAKEAYAGITPIGEMLDVVPAAGKSARFRPASVLEPRDRPNPEMRISAGRLIPDESLETAQWSELLPPTEEAGALSSLRLPLRFGGFSSGVMQSFAPLFRQMGFEPMHGGVMSGAPSRDMAGANPDPKALEPG